jgi:hypothetical protein
MQKVMCRRCIGNCSEERRAGLVGRRRSEATVKMTEIEARVLESNRSKGSSLSKQTDIKEWFPLSETIPIDGGRV